MPNKSFIKRLIERRMLQILGSYFIAGTSLIFFIQYLVDKYQFPSHYPTLSLFALIGILPSVLILAYFHGAPGKDEWTKVERIGIPINVLFIAGILFFGDSINIWEIDKEYIENNLPGVHLLYIGSPVENYGDCYNIAEQTLSSNESSALFALEELELKNLRLNIESELYSEFYNQNISIQLLKKDEEINFVNNTLKEYSNRKKIAEKTYEFFENPKHIIYVRVYSIKSSEGEIIQYVTDILSGLGDGFTSIATSGGSRETIEDIELKILDGIIAHITMIKNRGSGKVVKVDGDYIHINPGDLIVQENMNLLGFTIWNHNDKDGDGFTDKDSSYYKWINDVNRALDYMKRSDKYTIEKINTLQRKLDYLTSDSLRSTARGEHNGSFSYRLNVIDVRDTTVIAKLIELENPWVELNVGDVVRVDF